MQERAPVVVQVLPPGDEVAVYPMIGLPPDAGADQETDAWALPGWAETAVGAEGVVRGVTEADRVEAGPVPAAFLAVTVNV